MFSTIVNSFFGVFSAVSLFVSPAITPATPGSDTLTVSPVPQTYLDPLKQDQSINFILSATENAVQQSHAKDTVHAEQPVSGTSPAAEHRHPVKNVGTAPVTASHHVQPAVPASTSMPSQNQSDLYWLSRVIQAEAGAEPFAAKLAVGNVVLNRVNSPEYPNTIQGVIFQQAYGHYAFTSVANRFIYHTPDSDSVKAAQEVLNHQADVVPGALTFYNNAQTSPDNWVKTRPVIREIGRLTFAE